MLIKSISNYDDYQFIKLGNFVYVQNLNAFLYSRKINEVFFWKPSKKVLKKIVYNNIKCISK